MTGNEVRYTLRSNGLCGKVLERHRLHRREGSRSRHSRASLDGLAAG